jgi:hypothetical protein
MLTDRQAYNATFSPGPGMAAYLAGVIGQSGGGVQTLLISSTSTSSPALIAVTRTPGSTQPFLLGLSTPATGGCWETSGLWANGSIAASISRDCSWEYAGGMPANTTAALPCRDPFSGSIGLYSAVVGDCVVVMAVANMSLLGGFLSEATALGVPMAAGAHQSLLWGNASSGSVYVMTDSSESLAAALATAMEPVPASRAGSAVVREAAGALEARGLGEVKPGASVGFKSGGLLVAAARVGGEFGYVFVVLAVPKSELLGYYATCIIASAALCLVFSVAVSLPWDTVLPRRKKESKVTAGGGGNQARAPLINVMIPKPPEALDRERMKRFILRRAGSGFAWMVILFCIVMAIWTYSTYTAVRELVKSRSEHHAFATTRYVELFSLGPVMCVQYLSLLTAAGTLPPPPQGANSNAVDAGLMQVFEPASGFLGVRSLHLSGSAGATQGVAYLGSVGKVVLLARAVGEPLEVYALNATTLETRNTTALLLSVPAPDIPGSQAPVGRVQYSGTFPTLDESSMLASWGLRIQATNSTGGDCLVVAEAGADLGQLSTGLAALQRQPILAAGGSAVVVVSGDGLLVASSRGVTTARGSCQDLRRVAPGEAGDVAVAGVYDQLLGMWGPVPAWRDAIVTTLQGQEEGPFSTSVTRFEQVVPAGAADAGEPYEDGLTCESLCMMTFDGVQEGGLITGSQWRLPVKLIARV